MKNLLKSGTAPSNCCVDDAAHLWTSRHVIDNTWNLQMMMIAKQPCLRTPSKPSGDAASQTSKAQPARLMSHHTDKVELPRKPKCKPFLVRLKDCAYFSLPSAISMHTLAIITQLKQQSKCVWDGICEW